MGAKGVFGPDRKSERSRDRDIGGLLLNGDENVVAVILCDDNDNDGMPDPPAQMYLRAASASEFDEQGRVYQTHNHSVNETNGAVGFSLTSNLWYDRRGNVLKSAPPGGLVSKSQYDGAGRPVKTFATDGGGDPAPGAPGSWAAAGNVSGDIVYAQAETSFDKNSNVELVKSKQRFHNETATGALVDKDNAPKARMSFAAGYFDAINRTTKQVDVGTNGGAAWTRPATANDPSLVRSDDMLINDLVYNAAGWLDMITDPRAINQKRGYDNLGRQTQLIVSVR